MTNSNSNDTDLRSLVERARGLTPTNFEPDIVDDLADALEKALNRIDELELENKVLDIGTDNMATMLSEIYNLYPELED